jgi:hypothetical protein
MSRQLALLVSLTLTACNGDASAEPDHSRCFDDQPRPLEVVMDTTLLPPTIPGYECTGDAGWVGGACGELRSARAVLDGDLNLALHQDGFYGWWPMVEVTERDGARLCGVRFTDVSSDGTYTSCADPVCAASGRVTLSRFPASTSEDPIAVVVDVGFSNGARMRADFSVPDVRSPSI